MKRLTAIAYFRATIFTAVCCWTILASGLQLARAGQEAPEGSERDAQAKVPAAEKDPFDIPKGNAKQIYSFMEKLAKMDAEGETQEEQLEFAKKLMRTMAEASHRLLAAKPTPRQELDAYQYQLMALQGLVRFEDAEAAAELAKAIDAARSHRRPEIITLGWRSYLQQNTDNWRTMDDAAKEAFKAEIVAKVQADKAEPLDVSIVQAAANSLERVDDPFVVDLLAQAIPLLKESKDSKVRKAYADANLEGLHRRLNLPGNPMEISGTLLDGKKVDWNSYRGKVVLVDFWATWCGPCRAEVPNVLEMYEAYHDKGFDVLGISLDQTPEDARKYVEEMKLPWASIFPKAKADRGWNHPLAEYYGVSGIPTAILVGKDGKVVHMNARGPYLRQQLKELLGEPAEKPEDAKVADDESADS